MLTRECCADDNDFNLSIDGAAISGNTYSTMFTNNAKGIEMWGPPLDR